MDSNPFEGVTAETETNPKQGHADLILRLYGVSKDQTVFVFCAVTSPVTGQMHEAEASYDGGSEEPRFYRSVYTNHFGGGQLAGKHTVTWFGLTEQNGERYELASTEFDYPDA